MPDNTLSTLTQIITKVRRLTKSPSASQITDSEIKDYVNNFVLYDFPSSIKPEILETTLTFFTEPYIDTYETNTVDPTNSLYNFKNKYTNVMYPIYIAGAAAYLSQSAAEFYGIYPKTNSIEEINEGDGVTVAFTGTLTHYPLLINNVLFTSIDSNNAGLYLKDDGSGNLTGTGTGTIDYITGAYTLNFTLAPANTENIYAQVVAYIESQPVSMLYLENKFVLRPVPDGVYRVELTVYQRPTELLLASDSPELAELWQYIALGTAKKILLDRLDMETIALIEPEFRNQEILVNRRTIVQNATKRTYTIYSED